MTRPKRPTGRRVTVRRRASRPRHAGNGGGVVLLLLLGLGVLAAGAYATLCLVARDKVPSGVTVDGVAIGGLHTAAAETRLRDRLGPHAAQPVVVTGGGVSGQLQPGDSGLSVDVPGTVRAAGGGHSFLPGRLWTYFTGGDRVAPKVVVDAAKLSGAVRSLATRIDKDPVQGAISFVDGRPVTVAARNGQRLSRGASREAIRRGYLGSGPVRLPVAKLPPTITDAGVERAMSAFVRPAVAGPVRLVLAGHVVRATPRLFMRAITMAPDGRDLRPKLDVDELLTALAPVTNTVAGHPVPARIEVVAGRPTVVPSKTGITFDRSDLQRKFLASVVEPAGRRTVTVKGVSVQPDFTTADARRLKVTEQVARFTTSFPYADYRNVNLARGAELLDGTLLKPGETFSFNKVIGEPTVARGFITGYVLKGGIFTEDVGGGLSQLAGTLFNAEFLAGLQDVEHQVRSVYSSRFPKGRQVGVEYGKADLRFRDDSPYGVLVTASVTPSSPAADGTVTVTLWSTRRYDVTVRTGKEFDQRQPRIRRRRGKACEATVGYPGFSVNVFREFHRPGSPAVLRTEKTTAIYKASDTVVCETP